MSFTTISGRHHAQNSLQFGRQVAAPAPETLTWNNSGRNVPVRFYSTSDNREHGLNRRDVDGAINHATIDTPLCNDDVLMLLGNSRTQQVKGLLTHAKESNPHYLEARQGFNERGDNGNSVQKQVLNILRQVAWLHQK